MIHFVDTPMAGSDLLQRASCCHNPALQVPDLLQVALVEAARAGKASLLQDVMRLFAAKGWKPLLGPLGISRQVPC
jgi:hypothetical protein